MSNYNVINTKIQIQSKQVEKSHYNFSSYVGKDRWASYFHQIDETLNKSPETVLIIGKGDGIVGTILQKYLLVKQFDLDPDLDVDYCGSVSDASSIVSEKFDCVLCCQVLEHLPFELFEKSIKEICNITNKYLILSLPQVAWSVYFNIRLNWRIFSKSISFTKKNNHSCITSEHYWEIGHDEISLDMVSKVLLRYFDVLKSYSVRENSYHRFFILEKK